MSSSIHVHAFAFGAPHVKQAERDRLEADYQAWLATGKEPIVLRPGESGISIKASDREKNIRRAAKARDAKPTSHKE